MSRIQILFDYIFYRIYRFFKERGDNVPETKGTLILSMIQFLTLLDIVVFVRMIYSFPLPGKLYIIPLVALPAIVNWYRYERSFDIGQLEDRWKEEEEKKKVINGWLIGIYLMTSFLFPVVLGILEHNLKVI